MKVVGSETGNMETTITTENNPKTKKIIVNFVLILGVILLAFGLWYLVLQICKPAV